MNPCEELENKLSHTMEEFLRLSNILRSVKAELRRLWWLLVVTIDPVKREQIKAMRKALVKKADIVGAQLQECWDRRQEIKRQMAELECESA